MTEDCAQTTTDSAVFVRADGSGTAQPIVLLHPLPHSGAFFDTITPLLCRDLLVLRPDYPGFGKSPLGEFTPSIDGYAKRLLDGIESPGALDLVGFHTGCLVAAEMALVQPERIGRLVLIDVPCFRPEQANSMYESIAASGKYNDRALAGFHGAFAYPAWERLATVTQQALVIATGSRLREPTLDAASRLSASQLRELPEIGPPAFENGKQILAELMLEFLTGHSGQTD